MYSLITVPYAYGSDIEENGRRKHFAVKKGGNRRKSYVHTRAMVKLKFDNSRRVTLCLSTRNEFTICRYTYCTA